MPARIRVIRSVFPDRWLWVCPGCNPPITAFSYGRAEAIYALGYGRAETISAAADAGRRHLAAAHTPTWACVECGETFGSPDHPCPGNGPQSPEHAPNSWATAHRAEGNRG